MCLSLRKTLRRGRSGSPKMFLRVRNWRRSRRCALSLFLSAIIQNPRPFGPPLTKCSSLRSTRASERLAGLDLDDFAVVADALALVRLGLAHLADLGGEFADRLLVGAAH